MAILKEWYVTYSSEPHTELELPLICGRVYGLDGADWRGVAFRPIGRNGTNIIDFNGKMYELGEAKADYEEMFPNARERVLKALPERFIKERVDE